VPMTDLTRRPGQRNAGETPNGTSNE
jgi:hypothetical protein